MADVRTITEAARETPVLGEYDVVVLGGGPAGIAAAIAAGRGGARTILVERYGFLGGMGTAAGVTNFCGLHANVHGRIEQVVHGIADDILAGIDHLGGLKAPHTVFGKISAQAYDTSAYKIAADALLQESGAEVLFHAMAVGAVKSGTRRIEALLIETKSGRAAIRGRIFIDASGDGDLAVWAGASHDVGDSRGVTMYPSTMFRINDVERSAAAERAWERFPAIIEEVERTTGERLPRKGPIIRPQNRDIEWRCNVTQIATPDGRPVSAIDARELSYGEIEGRRQIAAAFDFLKRHVPAFANAYIVDIPPQIGVRETRRIFGDYVLTEDDVLDCVSFTDTIGVNGWPIEDHVAGDVLFRWQKIPESRGFNHLPYRMLLARDLDNLLVAGRCASMTHGGQSAARVSGPCFVMGEAAGTAASMALQSGGACRSIDTAALQDRLVRSGVYLGSDL